MRFLVPCAIVTAACVAGSANAEDPKLPKSAIPPTIAFASAKEADGKISLRVRTVESVPVVENRTVTVYESVIKIVGGRQVIEMVPVQKTVSATVMMPVRWSETELKVGDPGVEVRDLQGKEVPAKKLASLLEKETSILLSTAGPVDPFYLQLAKEGTLVVVAPPQAPKAGGVGASVPIPGSAVIPGVGQPIPLPMPVPLPKAVPIKE